MTQESTSCEEQGTSSFPRWLFIFWWCLLPGCLLGSLRISYEKSILTLRNGPQNIGFTFAHTHPFAFLFAGLSLQLSIVWLVIAAVCLIRRHRLSTLANWLTLALFCFCNFVAALPVSVYQWFMALSKHS